jgi:hypothetical protein
LRRNARYIPRLLPAAVRAAQLDVQALASAEARFTRVAIAPLKWLRRLGRHQELLVSVLPQGVERCIYHVAASANFAELNLQMHLCQRHMATATRRNARLVPFATRECTSACQECLREAQG